MLAIWNRRRDIADGAGQTSLWVLGAGALLYLPDSRVMTWVRRVGAFFKRIELPLQVNRDFPLFFLVERGMGRMSSWGGRILGAGKPYRLGLVCGSASLTIASLIGVHIIERQASRLGERLAEIRQAKQRRLEQYKFYNKTPFSELLTRPPEQILEEQVVPEQVVGQYLKLREWVQVHPEWLKDTRKRACLNALMDIAWWHQEKATLTPPQDAFSGWSEDRNRYSVKNRLYGFDSRGEFGEYSALWYHKRHNHEIRQIRNGKVEIHVEGYGWCEEAFDPDNPKHRKKFWLQLSAKVEVADS